MQLSIAISALNALFGYIRVYRLASKPKRQRKRNTPRPAPSLNVSQPVMQSASPRAACTLVCHE